MTLQLPALYVNVWTGKNSANKGAAFNSADVWITDKKCSSGVPATPITRRYATIATGALSDPGLPWSTYDVCVDAKTGSRQRPSPDDRKHRCRKTSPPAHLNFYLGEGSGTVSESGPCS